MKKKEISVYRINYEVKNKDNEVKNWSASIAAYDQKDAVDYLSTFLGKGYKISQLSREGGLHAITDDIRQKIIDAYLEETRQAQKDPSEKAAKKTKEPVGEIAPVAAKRGRSISKK